MKWTKPRAAAVATVSALIVAGCTSVPAPTTAPASRTSAPTSHATSPQAPTSGPAALSVDKAAFAGHGELAFVSLGELWVLDGATGALHHVPTPGMTPLDPAFSRDGRG